MKKFNNMDFFEQMEYVIKRKELLKKIHHILILVTTGTVVMTLAMSIQALIVKEIIWNIIATICSGVLCISLISLLIVEILINKNNKKSEE